ncbi:hypothetical protein ATANTOWER_011594 [Ataeniobius toweri]|uniref:Secreted protein n=1 Tax=Ataeniobius toweri TaxID=208326 RepID=A0ABU7BP23_9TELE|nr:hypothetical protein [Ataeniobius toweri]
MLFFFCFFLPVFQMYYPITFCHLLPVARFLSPALCLSCSFRNIFSESFLALCVTHLHCSTDCARQQLEDKRWRCMSGLRRRIRESYQSFTKTTEVRVTVKYLFRHRFINGVALLVF